MDDFFDWPPLLIPRDCKVYTIASRFIGGMSRNGITNGSSEPGGIMAIDVSFGYLQTVAASREFGWLYDELKGGAQVFRFPILDHVETVSAAELGFFPRVAGRNSVPFQSNGAHPFFSDDTGFAFRPRVPATLAALAGTGVIRLDFTKYGRVLKRGHLLGFNGQCNRVRSLVWAGNVATIQLRLPLRADLAVGGLVELWPRVIVQAQPQSVSQLKTMHEFGKFTQPGSITLEEYVGP